MFRVYFEAGARAMADYEDKHQIILDLGKRYSAGKDDLMQNHRPRAQQRYQGNGLPPCGDPLQTDVGEINEDLANGTKDFFSLRIRGYVRG